jgi:superfamily II DNA/RNA helicase
VAGSGSPLFVIAAVFHILTQPSLTSNGTISIILFPTRGLAIQTHLKASRFVKLSGLKSICLVGRDDAKRQIQALETGAKWIVGTPGRLLI